MNGEQNHGNSDQPSLSLKAQLESLLFVADGPVSLERLASVLQATAEQIEEALRVLNHEYDGRGLRLQWQSRRVQIVTAPETAEIVGSFLGLEHTGKPSPAAMETLAIIAYRQPITRAEIEAIRGVNSDSVLRTLVNRGLIEEQGRLEQAGRPIIYGTTFDFLQHFGLSSLEQLPSLPEMPAT